MHFKTQPDHNLSHRREGNLHVYQYWGIFVYLKRLFRKKKKHVPSRAVKIASFFNIRFPSFLVLFNWICKTLVDKANRR